MSSYSSYLGTYIDAEYNAKGKSLRFEANCFCDLLTFIFRYVFVNYFFYSTYIAHSGTFYLNCSITIF